jgi:hypothetical protein
MAFLVVSNLNATAVSASRINLSWSNPQTYDSIIVYRRPGGGAFTWLESISPSSTSYVDDGCLDGTTYYYKLRVTYTVDGDDSNIDNDTTDLPRPTGLSGSASDTTVHLEWLDNSQNESGFKIYQNGALIHTTIANAIDYTVTGLTPDTSYSFYVRAYNAAITSAASNTETVTTDDPPSAASLLTAIAILTTAIRLNWQDNSDNELDFHIYRSSTSAIAGFSDIGQVGANVKTYTATGLTSNTQYWFKIRAHNLGGYSAYCAVATAVTLAAIAAPTNLTCEAVSGTMVYLRFQDNSELEDAHSVERKTGGGAFAEIFTREPNRIFGRDTGLTAGTAYTYRVRARQGASYSGYSDEVTVTTLIVLTAPANLAVSEYQDTWLRLTWTKVAGAVGYRIAQSTPDEAGYAIIASVGGEVEYLKVTGLTAGVKYYFKILVYSGAGDSAYAASINQTTRAEYLPSKFEKLLHKSKPNLHFLVEVNPLMQLNGFTLTTAQTYTYECAFSERGADLDAVEENGVALTKLTSIATVEAAAGSWWHDVNAGKVYVHISDGGNPIDFTLAGSFWLYFTNWKTKDEPAIFNDHDYLPLVASDGIPDITQEQQQYTGDNFIITSGNISFINGKINGQHYFDRINAKYIWQNRKAKILAGGPGFTYAEYVVVNTGIINSKSISDQRFTIDLRDYRSGLHRPLPIEKYSTDIFANLNSDADGQIRPFGFGVITNAVPYCIDTVNRVFEFHNGRIKSVEQVTLNGTVLTFSTDYFIDYGLGHFTLARGLAYATSDILKIDFTGAVNDADEVISLPADVFKFGMNEWLNTPDAELDLDSIYDTKAKKTTALSLYMWKETGSQDFIRLIEQSSMTYSYQDALGRLGLRVQQTTGATGIKYIPSIFVFDFSEDEGQDSIYSSINIYYGEDPSKDRYSLLVKTANTVPWLYKVTKPLDIHVALASASDASTLGDLILADLNKRKINFSIPRSLYLNFPGDTIYFSRERFYDLSGTANTKLIRLLAISKQYMGGRTQIKAEVV